MTSSLAPQVAALRQKGYVGPDNVLAMRLTVFDDAMVSAADAEALMSLDESVNNACGDWGEFFVEALTDFIVNQQKPKGYVDDTNAKWLMDRVRRDSRIKPNELELLVRVLETAISVPASFYRFTLQQIKQAVIAGGGPRNTVTDCEVELLRRTLFAGASTGGIVITREEAEALFDIADAARGSPNAASWTDLFAKAVANMLMAAHGYVAPSREVALRRGRWLNDTSVNPASFMAKAVASLSNGLLANYRLADGAEGWAERNIREAALDHEAEKITAPEAQWLTERIKRDGMLSDIEKALLERVRAEASSLHPTLQPLFEWAA
jgi:hypothetical protein